MHILFIGDIFGRPGRNIVKDRLSGLVKEHAIDLVIANGENSAGGFGITGALAEDLFELGIDVITTGNHIWDKREIIDYFQNRRRQPAQPGPPPASPGKLSRPDCRAGACTRASKKGVPYAVINLQGRVFMAANDDPFRVADQLLKEIKAKVVFVDFHAETTSEKLALGWYLDGRVTALVGTHTHIPTADERVHARRHGLHHRCRYDRTLRQRDRCAKRNDHRPLPEQHACPVRSRHRRRSPLRGSHRL